MLDKVTKETFEPIKGGVFELVLGEEQTLPLELSAVLGTGLQGMANREQFSLHFRGPATPVCRSASTGWIIRSSAPSRSFWSRSAATPPGSRTRRCSRKPTSGGHAKRGSSSSRKSGRIGVVKYRTVGRGQFCNLRKRLVGSAAIHRDPVAQRIHQPLGTRATADPFVEPALDLLVAPASARERGFRSPAPASGTFFSVRMSC